MKRRMFLRLGVSGAALFVQACFFRRKKPSGPKIYDVYGNLQQISATSLTILGNRGAETFVLTPTTVRGTTDFTQGMYVHVYYTDQGGQKTATMVVEKVK